MIDGKTLKDLKDGKYLILFEMKNGEKKNARMMKLDEFISAFMETVFQRKERDKNESNIKT